MFTIINDTITSVIFNKMIGLSLKADYVWAIRLNRISLTMLGVWPEENKTKQQRLLSNIHVFFMINIILWSSLIPTVHSLLNIWGLDMMSMIDNLQYTLPLLIAVTKFTILWRKQNGKACLINYKIKTILFLTCGEYKFKWLLKIFPRQHKSLKDVKICKRWLK